MVIKSQDWAMGAKQPTHYVMEEQTPTPSTKFQAIYPKPTPSNKKSSLSLICIKSGQSPTYQVGKAPLLGGQSPKAYNTNPNPN